MRKLDIQRFVRGTLLPEMSGFAASGDLLYAKPIGPVLRGFLFEGSDFDNELFFVWAFVMPLYVPSDQVVLTFGRRIETRVGFLSWKRTWRLANGSVDDVPSLQRALRQGTGFLEKLQSPEMLINSLRWRTNPLGSKSIDRAIAFSLAWVGRDREARRKLRSLSKGAEVKGRENVRKEADQLLVALDSGGGASRSLLESWAAATVRALGFATTEGHTGA